MASADVNGTATQSDEMKEQEKSGESENSRYDPKTLAYMENILKEKHVLNTNTYPIASRLLEEEISKTKQSGQAYRDYRYVDIFREKPIKVVVKVMVPIKEYPKFNFVGKLLGPKGNTLRRLQEETMCKMTILGRGSMKDKIKEEELRQGLDPKYSHLSNDLHVEVSTLAPPSEAHGRMSYALKELRRYLIPDANDEISQEQLRELESYGGVEASEEPAAAPAETKPRQPQPTFRGKRPPGANIPSGASRAKVMSILEKARNAMENSKNYMQIPTLQNSYDRRASTRPYEEYPEEYDPARFEDLSVESTREYMIFTSGFDPANSPGFQLTVRFPRVRGTLGFPGLGGTFADVSARPPVESAPLELCSPLGDSSTAAKPPRYQPGLPPVENCVTTGELVGVPVNFAEFINFEISQKFKKAVE